MFSPRICVLFLIAAGLLSGCQTFSSRSDHLGSGVDEYRLSPCACGPVIPVPNIG